MTGKDTKERISDYLNHMLEAIQLIKSYIEGLTEEDFFHDKRTQQAVILNLLTLGEAVSHIIRISPDFPDQSKSTLEIYPRNAKSYGTRLF